MGFQSWKSEFYLYYYTVYLTQIIIKFYGKSSKILVFWDEEFIQNLVNL